jgi:putative hydrolase of the HAD superfamily
MKNDSTIEVVLFDFGGVIAEEGFREGLFVIAKDNGLNEEAFFQAAGDTIYLTGYIMGKASEHAFWEKLREVTGAKGKDADFRREILPRFIVRDWMLDLVKKLRAKHITVGILSDQTNYLDELNVRDDFFKWFDHIFNSYHLGKGKRDPGLFDDIAQRLNVKAERILFIDDNAGNVNRARQRGWQAIQYVNKEAFPKDFEKYLLMDF